MFYRDTWAEINLDRIKENILLIKKTVNKDFFAVIKANGYGCGDSYLANIAVDAGAAYLAVSSLDEALSLRNKGIEQNILVLQYISPKSLQIAKRNNITATASSLEWVQQAIKEGISGLKVHLKFDSGMNRIGFTNLHDLQLGLKTLLNNSVNVEGIYTHFACADSYDNIMCKSQLDKFKEALSFLNHKFIWIHCSNSDASFHFHENISNAVRCGIAMLGISSYQTNLQPALSLYSKIVNIKKIHKGETVGYGATYIAKADEWIATLPIGYADGWLRAHQGKHCVIDNTECQFIGRICMDQSMIRVPKYYPLGTIVELMGSNMPITRIAKELNTIPYEVMTLLSYRIAKVYIYQNEQISA
ncbi:alanine racemase [Clostridium malenominatum]|uniref:Alanine racemase n=1 Tax=Clostridium malenominatum TaxID=1539 RepID=A0ABN1IV42_9CLOT